MKFYIIFNQEDNNIFLDYNLHVYGSKLFAINDICDYADEIKRNIEYEKDGIKTKIKSFNFNVTTGELRYIEEDTEDSVLISKIKFRKFIREYDYKEK